MTLTKNQINEVSLWQNGLNADDTLYRQLATYAGLLTNPAFSQIATGHIVGLDTGTVSNYSLGFQPDVIIWYIDAPSATPDPETVFGITADLVTGDTSVYGSPGLEISFGESYSLTTGWDIRDSQFFSFVGVNPDGLNVLHTATGKYLNADLYYLALSYS